MISTTTKWKNYSREKGLFHIKATLTKAGTNLIDGVALTDGAMLIPTNGQIVSNPAFFFTDYISVEDGVTYNTNLTIVVLYNASKQWIGGSAVSSKTFDAHVDNETVAYVRMSAPLLVKQNAYINEVGTMLDLTDEDFMWGSVSFTDSMSGMDEIELGAVVTNSFSATLNNFDGKFDDYELAGATIKVQFGVVFEDSTEEWIDRGIYTIDRPDSLGNTIAITGYDFMDKLNKTVDLDLLFQNLPDPSSDEYYDEFATDLLTICGIELGEWDLPSNPLARGYHKTYISKDATYRAVLSWLLESVGGYARINPVTKKLDCKRWNMGKWGDSENIDGGIFNPWGNATTTDGGTIDPWIVVTDYDGGGILGDDGYSLEKVKSMTMFVKDIEVTGVRVYWYNNPSLDRSDLAGAEGYVLEVMTNPFCTPLAQQIQAGWIWDAIEGLKVRPFNATIFGDPSIEAGDTVFFQDVRGNYHTSIVTDITYHLNGGTQISCDVKSEEDLATEMSVSDSVQYVYSNDLVLQDRSVVRTDGTAYFDTSVTSPQFINSSLEEQKKSIEPLKVSALSKIKDADILTYNYKQEEDGTTKHIGLTIGEKYSVPEEVIALDKKGEASGVDLYAMISMAWKAIQELEEEIKDLKSPQEIETTEVEIPKETAKEK